MRWKVNEGIICLALLPVYLQEECLNVGTDFLSVARCRNWYYWIGISIIEPIVLVIRVNNSVAKSNFVILFLYSGGNSFSREKIMEWTTSCALYVPDKITLELLQHFVHPSPSPFILYCVRHALLLFMHVSNITWGRIICRYMYIPHRPNFSLILLYLVLKYFR